MIEVLVVIAIVSGLAAVLLPAVQASREAARATQCKSNIKQLALGCLRYHDVHQKFPPNATFSSDDDPRFNHHYGPNWAIEILPMIEEDSLYRLFDRHVPISDPYSTRNRDARGTELSVMKCPTDTGHDVKFARSAEGDNWARGNYGANGGLGYQTTTAALQPAGSPNAPFWKCDWSRGVMGVDTAVGLRRITDGSSRTMMLGELRVGSSAADRRGTWAMGTAGASGIWGCGTDDDIGPNACQLGADNVDGCIEVMATVGMPTLMGDCMSCSETGSSQATIRSRHPLGAHIAMCDGSVRFISNSIEAGPIPPLSSTVQFNGGYPSSTFLLWQRLIASADGMPGDFGE